MKYYEAIREVRKFSKDDFLYICFIEKQYRYDVAMIYIVCHTFIQLLRRPHTDMMLTRIKLQWWRDSIDSIFHGSYNADHPLLNELNVVVKKYTLSNMFVYMLDACDDYIAGQVRTRQNFIQFLQQTYGYMFDMISSITQDNNYHHNRNICISYGIIYYLRTIRYSMHNGLPIMYDDLHTVIQNSSKDMQINLSASKEVLFEIKLLIQETKKYTQLTNDQTCAELYSFYTRITNYYIDIVEKCSYDVIHHNLEIYRGWFDCKLFYKHMLGSLFCLLSVSSQN